MVWLYLKLQVYHYLQTYRYTYLYILYSAAGIKACFGNFFTDFILDIYLKYQQKNLFILLVFYKNKLSY